MKTPYSKVVKNYIEYSRKPFTSRNVVEETSIDSIKVKRVLAILLKKGTIKVISRQGKYKIYIKNSEYKEEAITNEFGYNFRMMQKMFNIIRNKKISSSRKLAQDTEYHRRAVDRYLLAFASARIITIKHGHYKILVEDPDFSKIGKKIDASILKKLREKSSNSIKPSPSKLLSDQLEVKDNTEVTSNIIFKRDITVSRVMKRAFRLQARIAEDKQKMRAEIEKYLLQAPPHAKNQENIIELVSTDRKSKIKISYQENVKFCHNLQIAQQKIEDCLQRWDDDSITNIKSVVAGAFKLDQKDRISKNALLDLVKYNIKDEQWMQAVDLIEAVIEDSSSNQNLSFYERTSTDKEFQLISLDLSTI